MKTKTIFRHVRDIIFLPLSVLILVPLVIYRHTPDIIPDYLSIKLFSGLMFLFGAVLFCWTVVLFQSVAEGTLAPWTDKKKLVVIGPYAHCRNPMIAGVVLILISESLWFRSMPILLWASVFFVINTCFFIIREEPFLEKKFGDQYRNYKRNVPRWIPKMHAKN